MTSTYEQADITALAPIPNRHGDYCTRCERDLPCVCGRLPYVSLFLYDDEQQMYFWRCNVCGTDVSQEPCEAHAPNEVPGFDLIPCDATPRHERMWVAESDTFRGDLNPCLHCLYEDNQAEIARLRHEAHGAWRSWRVTGGVVRVLCRLRIASSWTGNHWGPCNGCVTISWRRFR